MRKEMLALLGYLRKQIGLRSDTASASGSLHAKTNYLIAQSNIKSIQRGTIGLSATSLSAAVTISGVNTDKTKLNFLGARAADKFNTGHSYEQDDYAYALTSHYFVTLQLTNNNTVTATRIASNNVVATISYEVIEFY